MDIINLWHSMRCVLTTRWIIINCRYHFLKGTSPCCTQGHYLWTVERPHFSSWFQDEYSYRGLVSLANDSSDEHLDHLDPSRSDDKISPPIISSPPSSDLLPPDDSALLPLPTQQYTEPQWSRAEQGVSSHPVDINPRPPHKGIPTQPITSSKALSHIFSCLPSTQIPS